MRKALAIALLLASTPAIAADDAVTATPGSGLIMHSKDIGALKQQPFVGLGNDTGASIIGAGTTVPVSGSVGLTGTPTVLQGSPPWSVNPSGTPSVWGIQQAGISTIVNGVVMLCAATTGAPTYVTGTSNFLSCDLSGNLRTSGGGGGGGAVTVADGADVTQGAKADTVCASDTANPCSVIQLLKRINQNLAGSIPAGAALIGAVNVNNANNNGRAASSASSPVVPSAAPTTYHVIWPNNVTGVLVHGGLTTLVACQMSNNSTTAAYLKIYNKATAPTTGSDTPVVTAIIPGPAAGGGGSNIVFGPGGLSLSAGLGVAVTTVITDADTTGVPAAATYAINCQYE